jgi:hypothetical protein
VKNLGSVFDEFSLSGGEAYRWQRCFGIESIRSRKHSSSFVALKHSISCVVYYFDFI